MTSLVAFEAAERQLSFTRAAGELGVTQAAVSRQILGLEQDLGFALFRRLHRRIELTERGRTLAGVLTGSLNLIAQTIPTLAAESEPDELVIGTTVALTQLWLLPRLSEFRRAHAGIDLRLVTQDTRIDLERDMADVVIRYGEGAWPDGRAELLREDEVFPVASPAYVAAMGGVGSPAELAGHVLLDYVPADPSWLGWRDWLASQGVARPVKPAMRMSFYTEVLQATLAGQGVCLGHDLLVADALAQGRLLPLTDRRLRPRSAYFLVAPNRERLKPSAEAFVAWLRARVSAHAAA
jgi:DNA-binding transcriptional LysR family regulator